MQEQERKPVIGVMPLWDDEKESLWMLPGYLEGLRQAGGLPLILPFSDDRAELDQLANLCDAFLFTGGHDVSPSLYHEKALDPSVICCSKRDEMESFYLQHAIDSGKPILGICRGIQFINAALGGTLYQDLPTQHPSSVDHHQTPPYDIPVHTVRIEPGSPLAELLGTEDLKVNSYHHQAVKALAPRLSCMATSPDGLVEAFYMPDHPFLWAVQWHPEFSYLSDEASRKLFCAFVEKSK